MVFGIISGIVKFFFSIFRFFFHFIERIFTWISERVKFIVDAVREENKAISKIKAIGRRNRKLIRLNDEI